MKLNFKDLKQQKFSIDAEPSETVADVKQKVAEEKGFDAAQMRLIWSGKILADANTIGSYEIKPTDQIVCMVQKPKAAAAPVPTPAQSSASTSAPAKAPATPAPAPAAQTPSAPAPAAAAVASTGTSDVPANAPATPSPAPATAAGQRSFQDTSAMVVGPQRQAAISNLENMGFERSQVEAAMRAAYYNPDRAVEYLLNGIPESAAQPPPAQPAPQSATSPPPAAAAPAQSSPAAADPAPTAEGDEPVNLFEAAAAASQGGRGAARGAAPGAAAAGSGAAGVQGAGAGTTNLDFLRDNPTFQQLRQLVQQQPQMLEHVLQNLSASNPQLAQTISQNQDQFVQLLAEGGGAGDESGGPVLPPGAQAVSVTPEERDAIERLCRLGFDRDVVIQAYFACDKNEELAANFLFDNPDDDADQ